MVHIRKRQDLPPVAGRLGRRLLAAMLASALLGAGCAGSPRQATAAGGAMGQDAKAPAAQQTLLQIFRAYESAKPMDSFLDKSMVDFQGLLDDMRDSQNQQKQISIAVRDVHEAADGANALIQLHWEKRYLALPGMTPRLTSGQASFHMKLTAAGWKLAGINGDNVFAAQNR